MLRVLLVLAIFVTFYGARCQLTPYHVVEGSPLSGCVDTRGKEHDFDTAWEYDCLHCECLPRIGIYCCSAIKWPKGYDQKTCKTVFQKSTCSYVPVKRDNPSVSCKVLQYTG